MKSNQASFCQYSMWNSQASLPARTLNWLIGSWAFTFRMFIYPLIKPELFDCLYSNVPSRPATPPQVNVSLVIIQQMFGKTDDEMYDWMMGGDLALRVATNTMGMPIEKLPVSENAFYRFKELNRQYAEEHDGYSPLDECLRETQYGMWAIMGLPLDRLRIDSTQVSANIERLSREALLYRMNFFMVKKMKTAGGKEMESRIRKSRLAHYLDANDDNVMLYHSRISRTDKRATLCEDANQILTMCTADMLESEAGKLFTRVLSEQTVVEDGKRRFASSDDDKLHSTDMQNPSDPDATFRKKANKEYIGYVLSVVEAVGTEGSQVISWDFEQNVQTDPVMAMAFIKQAQAIIDGIAKYNQVLGIENPGNMSKCLEVLRSREEMVVQLILNAHKSGRRIPRTSDFGFAWDNVNQIQYDEGIQQLDLDDLLAGYGLLQSENPNKAEAAGSTADGKSASKADSKEGTTAPTTKEIAESYYSSDEASVTSPSEEPSANSAETSDSTKAAATADSEVSADTSSSAKDREQNPYRTRLITGPDGRSYLDDVLLEEYLKDPDFALLDPELRREAILQSIRDSEKSGNLPDLLGKIIAADGAYSTDELMKMAADAGYSVLPTDLFGKKSNPIIGLYTIETAEGKPHVVSCPMGHPVQSETVNKNGTLRICMDSEHCANCPFRNDCKAKHQLRKNNYAITLAPNAQSRILLEALIRTEDYKAVGRFRNGIETIPSLLHNVFDIDFMPIGMETKRVCTSLKLTALNIWKFFGSLRRQAHIQPNRLLV